MRMYGKGSWISDMFLKNKQFVSVLKQNRTRIDSDHIQGLGGSFFFDKPTKLYSLCL